MFWILNVGFEGAIIKVFRLSVLIVLESVIVVALMKSLYLFVPNAEMHPDYRMLPNELDNLPPILYPQLLPHLIQVADLPNFTGVVLPSILKVGTQIPPNRHKEVPYLYV